MVQNNFGSKIKHCTIQKKSLVDFLFPVAGIYSKRLPPLTCRARGYKLFHSIYVYQTEFGEWKTEFAFL